MKRVAIVGFGYIGTCIGAVLADRGYDVTGIDPRKEVADEIAQGKTSLNEPGLHELVHKVVAKGAMRATTSYAPVAEADVVIVTVGTPLGPNHDPDMRQILDASERLAEHLQRGQLVMLKSTVPPGTTEDVVRPILEKRGLRSGADFHLAFCPERLAEGRAIAEFLAIPVVVGGAEAESTKAAAAFWKAALPVDVLEVSSAKAAEMSKLADNLFIDLNVALANEIAMLCDRIGMDATEVIAAANSLPKGQHHVNILAPGAGVGGYCLTKDPWFVHHLGKLHGLELHTPVASRTANDGMPRYTFEIIRDELKRAGKDLANSKVAVLGIAFKSNTGDVRYTPVKETLALLEKSGANLAVCDPWVHARDARSVTSVELTPSIDEAVRGADAIAILAGHQDFREFPLERLGALAKPGALLLDGRLMYGKAHVERARAMGLRFRGVGR